MNREAMRAVAERIESSGDGYSQCSYGGPIVTRERGLLHRNECGTPCCIAGHAALLMGRWPIRLLTGEDHLDAIHRTAQETLGLDEEDGLRLFADLWPVTWFQTARIPRHEYLAVAYGDEEMAEPARAHACSILRLMADLGTVDLEAATGSRDAPLPAARKGEGR